MELCKNMCVSAGDEGQRWLRRRGMADVKGRRQVWLGQYRSISVDGQEGTVSGMREALLTKDIVSLCSSHWILSQEMWTFPKGQCRANRGFSHSVGAWGHQIWFMKNHSSNDLEDSLELVVPVLAKQAENYYKFFRCVTSCFTSCVKNDEDMN